MNVNNINSLPDVGGVRGHVGGIPVPRMPDDGVCGHPKGMTTHPRHRGDHPRPVCTTYQIELRAITDDLRPAEIRLRGALKMLLRAFGLRCVTCRETNELNASPDASGSTETACDEKRDGSTG